MYSRIIGTGGYLPEKILTNHDLAQMVDTSDEWVFSRTGIRERHIVAENQTTSDLAFQAAQRAIEMAGVDHSKRGSQISQEERRRLVQALKGLRLTVTGALALEEAMVTGGGVSTKEIDPRTMESKVAPGIYFAGEMIDGSAASGGYNLQQAFSTGYLAGQSAAMSA